MTQVIAQLSVRRGSEALEFYKAAFGAVIDFQAPGDSVIAQLSVDGGTFWVTDEAPEFGNFSPETVGGTSARLLLLTEDPHALFDRAIAAGAAEYHPVQDDYGWRLGRVVDPYGHHWEIGKPLIPWPPH
jgi:PhnB protein